MNNRSVLILIVLLALISASVFGYITLTEESSKLIADLSRQETTLQDARSQKLDLLEELRTVTRQGQELQNMYVSLKDALRDSQRQILISNSSCYRLTGLNAEMAAQTDQIRQENFSLIGDRDSLDAQLADLIKENEVFKARLSSVEELKKAIHEVHTHRLGAK